MNHHYKGCGRCKHCRGGWSQLCRGGITVYGVTGHGGHAPYMKAPAFTLVPLPDALSFEEGAAVSCGTGTAYGALRRLDVSGRDTLAVFGQGPVGLSATLLGRAMGARIIAVDVSPERLALARELGAEHVIDPRQTDPVRAIHDLTDGDGRGVHDGLHRLPRAARAGRAQRRHLGSGRVRGRRQQRHAGSQQGPAPPADHAARLVDLLEHRPGGVRALHRRPQDPARQASSRTAGVWSRPKRPTASSIPRRRAKASSSSSGRSSSGCPRPR